MALIPIESPARLRSPAEAAALYRCLGDERVTVRGFRTNEARRIEPLVAAIEPGRDATLHFEGGLLDERGWARLAELAAARATYLDLHAGGANLRVWPDHAKVYARLPHDGVAGVAYAFGAPLRAGENRCGDTTIVIDPVAGYPLAVALTTPARELALRMFRALGDPQLSRGHIAGPTEAAKGALAPFLGGLRATVHVSLDLALDAARDLATACADVAHVWQARHVHVELPGGRVHGFLEPSRASDDDRARWLERICAAAAAAAAAQPPA